MDGILTLQRIKVNRENRLACNYKTVEQSLTGFASQGLSAPATKRNLFRSTCIHKCNVSLTGFASQGLSAPATKRNLLECGYIHSHSVSWLTPCDARKFIQKHLHPQVQRVMAYAMRREVIYSEALASASATCHGLRHATRGNLFRSTCIRKCNVSIFRGLP